MSLAAVAIATGGIVYETAVVLGTVLLTIAKCVAVAAIAFFTFSFLMALSLDSLFRTVVRGWQRILEPAEPAPLFVFQGEPDWPQEVPPIEEGDIEGGDLWGVVRHWFGVSPPYSPPSSEDFLSFFQNLDEESRQALKGADPEIFPFVPALMVFSYGCGDRKNEPQLPPYFQGKMRQEALALRRDPPPLRTTLSLRGILRNTNRFDQGPFSPDVQPYINRLKETSYNLPADFWGALRQAADSL